MPPWRHLWEHKRVIHMLLCWGIWRTTLRNQPRWLPYKWVVTYTFKVICRTSFELSRDSHENLLFSWEFVKSSSKISYCSFFWFPSYVNTINQSISQSFSENCVGKLLYTPSGGHLMSPLATVCLNLCIQKMSLIYILNFCLIN